MRLLRVPPAAAALAGLAAAASAVAQSDGVYLPPNATQGTVLTPQSILDNPSQTPNPQYSNLLGNTLWLFDAQRSGILPADNRVWWRNNSLPDDGLALSGVNLSGGYYDAANFIKATFPLSWTLESLAWGGMLYGTAYNLTDQGRYLESTLRWGYDWMLEAANVTSGTLWVQVANVSDTYWGSDLDIPAPRPAYQVNASAPGTDAFAGAASAFAAGSMFYRGVTLPTNATSPAVPENSTLLSAQVDRRYADTLLDRAIAMWNLATTSTPQQVYQTVVPAADGAYPSSGFLDELTMSSIWLALATGNASYADTAANYYGQMLASPNLPNRNGQLGGPLNWDQKSPATAMLFVVAAQYNQSLGINATRFQNDIETYLDRVVGGSLDDTSLTSATSQTPGLLWYKGYSEAASLNPALNTAFLLHLYAGYTSDSNKAQQYRTFADQQLDYALGKNPMNTVYICGQHPNSYVNPQSSLASGGNGFGDINTVPEQEAYVLYGGVPGGPNKQNLFYDLRSDYVQTEVALDYQAPMVNLVANRIQWQANNGPPAANYNPWDGGPLGDPVYVALQPGTRVTPPYEPEPNSSRLSVAASLAIGIACSVIFLILCWVVGFFFGHKLFD